MQFELSHACLVLDDKTGGIVSYRSYGVEMIAPALSPRALFELRFRDAAGEPIIISSNQATMSVDRSAHRIVLNYSFSEDLKLHVIIEINAKADGSVVFGLRMNHQRSGYLESLELPILSVREDFVATGGAATLLWPGVEGVLIEDPLLRNKTGYGYQPVEYPNRGWCGYYPGVVQMQFLAYMREGAGLYYATHDAACTTKEVEYCAQAGGVRMIIRAFPGAIAAGSYTLPYDVVIKPFKGPWFAAADIYRNWVEKSKLPLPPKLMDRKDRESWIEASPVVITYPVTGVGHHAGPTQPNEYFPFTNALPAIKHAAEKTASTVLVVPMQWEGTAPWAPPYVWPPRGGEENMRQFANELHHDGHRVGLYCSGLAWTNTANTGDGGYNRKEEFEKRHLITEMCQGPKGEYASLICNGEDIRFGYDFCVSSKVGRKIVFDELKKIASAGIDYVQLFDQNLGAASYQCYDARHGHPPAPGPWQAESMRDLLATFRKDLANAGYSNVRMGCESGAAEPYIEHLPLNDLRFFLGYNYGRPVSALAYVYHEYTTNFMGNQCEALLWIDHVKSPYNLALRFTHSFLAGDLLMVILKNGGQMHWAWCAKWDVTPPDQEKHWAFVKNLNAWRQTLGKPFLYFGRMLAPYAVTGAETVSLHLRCGEKSDYAAVLSSRWESPDHEVAQFLVNYTDTPQKITVECPMAISLYISPDAKATTIKPGQEFIVPAMTAVMAKESK